MRYLVTGGLGVIGSRFVEDTVRDGDTAVVLDCGRDPRHEWSLSRLLRLDPRIRVVRERIEMMSPDDLSSLVSDCDFVLHAAAHTGIPHSEEAPGEDWRSNVDATRSLLEALRVSGSSVPTVMLSSVKPYGLSGVPSFPGKTRMTWSPRFAGVDEDFPLEPDEPYAASKMAQSALAMAYARSYGCRVTVLRCSNLYGDSPCHGPRHGWLTWFCICAALGWPIEVQGTGQQTRDMLFCTDVRSAVLSAVREIDALSGRVFNIGGGPDKTVSVTEAVLKLREISTRDVLTTSGPGRRNEDMLFFTDFGRFNAATGWSPEVGVDEGMERIYVWAAENADALKEVYGAFEPGVRH